MAFEARGATREDAQRRVDRIRAFREELAELERLGVVARDAGQQERLRRFHDEAVASLAARFDVDSTESERRLSLGMRIASLLGAVALSAAVYFFFYRFWGSLPGAAQVLLLAGAPLVAVAGMEVAARTWSAFAALLAYAYGLQLLLVAAVVGFTVLWRTFSPWRAPRATGRASPSPGSRPGRSATPPPRPRPLPDRVRDRRDPVDRGRPRREGRPVRTHPPVPPGFPDPRAEGPGGSPRRPPAPAP